MEAQGLNKRKINNLFTLKNAVWETSPKDKNLSRKKLPVTPRPIVHSTGFSVLSTKV